MFLAGGFRAAQSGREVRLLLPRNAVPLGGVPAGRRIRPVSAEARLADGVAAVIRQIRPTAAYLVAYAQPGEAAGLYAVGLTSDEQRALAAAVTDVFAAARRSAGD